MRLRWTLGASMALVVAVAFGLSVFRDPSPFWASSLFTLVVILLGFATLGAMARRGSSRMPLVMGLLVRRLNKPSRR